MKQYRTLIIILIIVAAAIYLIIPNTPGLPGRAVSTHLGLDLVGGVQALLEADVPASQNVTSAEMNTARQIVENRVNGLGVSEALVQVAGSRRIIVEIPGVKDPDQAISTIKTTALLEFVDMTALPVQTAQTYDGQKIKTDFQTGADVAPTPTAIAPTEVPTVTAQTTPAAPEQVFHTIMTGKVIKTVAVVSDQLGGYQVSFELDSEGAQIFSDFTKAHVGQVLAIVLDKQVISAPTINNAITEGKGVITGRFTYESANLLAVQLRYGSLPIPLKVVQSNTVGPTLGQDSLRRSLLAGSIGLAMVIIFMALYYRLPGLVADVALLVYALIAYALFRAIPITLTLPGIAGFVLSIGMAVDANILIFERMKEELRAGRTLRSAIELGWGRAWPSIRDSNLSTIITCTVLYFFGSAFGASIVKGFSLTLLIGVAVSLFTAIIVSRTFLHLVLDNVKFAGHTKWFGI